MSEAAVELHHEAHHVRRLRLTLVGIDGQNDLGAVYHIGDLVGYAPWPNEVVDLLRARGITGVAGNYDSTVATDYKHCGCKYEDPRQEELAHLHALPLTEVVDHHVEKSRRSDRFGASLHGITQLLGRLESVVGRRDAFGTSHQHRRRQQRQKKDPSIVWNHRAGVEAAP